MGGVGPNHGHPPHTRSPLTIAERASQWDLGTSNSIESGSFLITLCELPVKGSVYVHVYTYVWWHY